VDDHDHTERTLTLLARRGAYEVLQAMHTRGGVASFAEISADTPRPLTLLRALATEGFLVSRGGGSLDGDTRGDTHFSLTGKGEAVFDHLLRLRQWTASRAVNKRIKRGVRKAL
jgi:DNA-binding HxlR family transcriptional regulator